MRVHSTPRFSVQHTALQLGRKRQKVHPIFRRYSPEPQQVEEYLVHDFSGVWHKKRYISRLI